MIVQHRSSCRFEDASEDLNRNYIAGPQLVAEQPNHLCPAPTKLFELHFKLSDEAASAAVRFKLPVLFAADIELNESSAHLSPTGAPAISYGIEIRVVERSGPVVIQMIV